MHQYPAQLFYRQIGTTYIGTVLESVFHCLRTRNALNLRNRVYFSSMMLLSFVTFRQDKTARCSLSSATRLAQDQGAALEPLSESTVYGLQV